MAVTTALMVPLLFVKAVAMTPAALPPAICDTLELSRQGVSVVDRPDRHRRAGNAAALARERRRRA